MPMLPPSDRSFRLGAPSRRTDLAALGWYWVTTMTVVAAALIAQHHSPVSGARSLGPLEPIGGGPYRHIAEVGYSYRPGTPANCAYFPAMPLLIATLARLTGLDTLTCAALIAQLSLAAAFVALAHYLAARSGADALTDKEQHLAVAAFAVAPMAFFLRQGTSEPLFLLFLITALLGIERRWPLVAIALLAGAAAGTRPVGVALAPALLWHAWRRLAGQPRRFVKACGIGLLGCWGLFAYMTYLGIEFGEPLAMAKSQWVWLNRPSVEWPAKMWALLTFEPLWGVFVPGHVGYWRIPRDETPILPALFDIRFLNPIFFVGAAVATGYGAWRRWLTAPEIIIAVGLLLIPWQTRAYEMALQSHARFALVVVPVYIVVGRLLARLPRPFAWLAIAASGAYLLALSAFRGAGFAYI